MSDLLVTVERLPRWLDNFASRHGGTTTSVAEGTLAGEGDDGSTFRLALPFGREYDGPAELEAFVGACTPPGDWGVLLVRKGGFAVARLRGSEVVDSKVGQRHVQGRTKAGGQSQQRFARRRDNQARAAYEAAADHAARILGGTGLAGTGLVVTGGDHVAVDAVLEDARLSRLVVVPPWLSVPDPRRRVLEDAVVDACSVKVEVLNADRGASSA
jgi:hypothetical protein